MTRSQWEDMCELIEDGDDFSEILYNMEFLDIFYLGYDFCMADKLYKED